MQIEVNGDQHDVAAKTVTEALAELGWGGARVATALNGTFLSATMRDATALSTGDRLEVLTAMQGG